MIFFNFKLDLAELDEVDPPAVFLGIEPYSFISFSRVFYVILKRYDSILFLFDHHRKV